MKQIECRTCDLCPQTRCIDVAFGSGRIMRGEGSEPGRPRVEMWFKNKIEECPLRPNILAERVKVGLAVEEEPRNQQVLDDNKR